MKLFTHQISVWFSVACLLAWPVRSPAFALLGPVQPWMQMSNGVVFPSDIGGPMNIGSGYRWNVPVITYGFDQSFINYFGTNGVAAVTSAIQIINNLPPASSLVLANYPEASRQINYTAQVQSLYDLKSEALQLLVEHLGLAPPTRNIFVIKQWTSLFAYYGNSVYNWPNTRYLPFIDWEDWAIPDYISEFNYDPISLSASLYNNTTLYFGDVENWDAPAPYIHQVHIYSADDLAISYTAVADFGLNSGEYYTGLTYDDVGGLSYLLSTNTVNYENLLPGISGIGTNANSFVNGAWRPGVDKITFISQPVNALTGSFLPMTNQFTDTYITNGNFVHQQVQRVISQPDFLFTVADTDAINMGSLYQRTGTTNWINNSIADGNTNGDGPGVIQPPVQISFNKMGAMFHAAGPLDTTADDATQLFASFDGSTNDPVIYPVTQSGTNQMTVRMWLELGKFPNTSATSYDWNCTSAIGGQFIFQTSTDLVNWVNLFTVTNNGSVNTFQNYNPASPSRFYRLKPAS